MKNIERSILLMPKVLIDSSFKSYWIVTNPMENWSFRWVPYSVESGKTVHTINFTKRIDLRKNIDPFISLYLNAGGDSSVASFGCQRKLNSDTIVVDIPARLLKELSGASRRIVYHMKKIDFVYNKDSVFSYFSRDEIIIHRVSGYDQVK